MLVLLLSARAENAKEHGNSIFLEAKKSKETKKVITAEYNKAIVAYDSALKEVGTLPRRCCSFVSVPSQPS
jgi:hypothetical protein